MPHLRLAALWRSLDKPGTEYCGLWRLKTGWELAGDVLTAFNDQIITIRYHVLCDDAWNVKSVRVKLKKGTVKRTVHLTVDEDQRWWLDDQELFALRGCSDIDLDITPAMNTFLLSRLGLKVGQRHRGITAWIRFPDLVIKPLHQEYHHIEMNRYQYENSYGLITEIEVDRYNMVVHYGEKWERDVFVNCLSNND